MLYVIYIINKELSNTIELQEGNSKQKPIYYLEREGMFCIKLFEILDELLPKRITIIKSKYKFCKLDFLIVNNDNLRSIYIEHKGRNNNSYDEGVKFIINVSKITNIIKNYNTNKAIIILDFYDDIFFIDDLELIKKQNIIKTYKDDIDRATDNYQLVYDLQNILLKGYDKLEELLLLSLIHK